MRKTTELTNLYNNFLSAHSVLDAVITGPFSKCTISAST